MQVRSIGLVGYGEVGKIFASGLMPAVRQVSAWDLKFAPSATADAEKAHAQGRGIVPCSSMQELCAASDLVISAVTASNTLAVAEEAAQFLRPGAAFLDLNSASPGTRQKAAAAVDARGAHYVEAGVMTSVPPYGIKVPLLGGAEAGELAGVLAGWGCDAKAVSEKLGVASAIKMRESANTVREAGFPPLMAAAIAEKQQWVADQAAAGVFRDLPKGASWQEYADRLVAARDPEQRG